MRIACVHVPQFALQCVTRRDPSLRGAPIAVVAPRGTGGDGADSRELGSEHERYRRALTTPVVQACSRAAWAIGVRLGMTATAAHAVSSELRVVTADPQIEAETTRAIADAMLAQSPVVDDGGRGGPVGAHAAIYCEVPSGMRGTSFGDRLVEVLGALGLVVRIGIADDRFTAWVAALGDRVSSRGPATGPFASRRPQSLAPLGAPLGILVAQERSEVGPQGLAPLGAPLGILVAQERSEVGPQGLAPLGAPLGILLAQERSEVGPATSRGSESLGGSQDDSCRDDLADVVSVPRGGSAAFLASRPLSLLGIGPEVQHMLEALGVRTLGEFAALPAPSVSRPADADYQALARGEGGRELHPYRPDRPIRERIALHPASGSASSTPVSCAAAVAMLATRVALRLAGRGRGAARLEVVVADAEGEHVLAHIPYTPGATPQRRRVLESPEELADAIGHAIGDRTGAVWRLDVTVTAEAVSGEADSVIEPTELAIVPSRREVPLAGSVSVSRSVPAPIEALSLVLSTTGSTGALGWGASAAPLPRSVPAELRAERRDAHRRTRRGKQSRRPRGVDAPVQAWLFAERK